MKILVTGGSGFIGSHLVDQLKDHQVIIVDDLSTGNHYVPDVKQKIHKIKPFKVDVIFHLAAISKIDECKKNIQKAYKTNSTGTFNLLQFKPERFIYASSSTVIYDIYHNPYTYTKWLGEKHCEYHKHTHVTIARLFNVYGPRQKNNVIHNFQKSKTLKINGDGSQKRDFIHVQDVVTAFIKMINSDYPSHSIFNIGSGKNLSINEIADMFNKKKKYIDKSPGIPETLANIHDSQELLNFNPKFDIREYIKNMS